MSERKASMGDKVYRGDVVKYIRNNISLDTFMKRTVQKADESCWDLCDKLNFVPAIEDEQPERKRGKWIYVRGEEAGNALYMCSACGKGDIHAPEVRASYCWHCGAQMEGSDAN